MKRMFDVEGPAVKLTENAAMNLLEAHDHGVLCTLHVERGIDAVPVVYVTDADGYLGVPVDRVKPKSSLQLQRVANLEADDRATLLIEHWDNDDWSRLWWVRAELRWQGDDEHQREGSLADGLSRKYAQYRIDEPFAKVLVLRIIAVTGWTAA
jgi:Pyridoxamine 5'-phosphate oxidase